MEEEKKKKIAVWKIIVPIFSILAYAGLLTLLKLKDWITTNILLIIIIATVFLGIITIIAIVVIHKQGNEEEEKNVEHLSREQCRDYLREELKTPFYGINIDTDCNEFEEGIDNYGTTNTEMYFLKAKIYATNRFIVVGMRTDNLKFRFIIFRKSEEKQAEVRLESKLNRLADSPSEENVRQIHYYDPYSPERILKTETITEKVHQVEKKEAEPEKPEAE